MSTTAAFPHHLQSSVASQSTPKASQHRASPSASPQHSSPRSNSPNRGSSTNIDIEGLLRLHGGDTKRALESVLAEKANLLWKLIEKQRVQCASLAADNDRLRSERDRANTRLASAGLSTLPAKKLSTSASTAALALKANPGVVRRTQSDCEGQSKPAVHDSPGDSDSASTGPPVAFPMPSPSYAAPQATPLPAPLTAADTKLRHESRMAFPPEVRSFMSLVDSPRDAKYTIQPSPGNPALSPASTYSEHLSEVGPGHVPPPSSRALAITTDIVHEEPGEGEMDVRLDVADPLPPRKASLSPLYSSRDTRNPLPLELGPLLRETAAFQDNDSPRQSTENGSTGEKRSPEHVTALSPSLLPHTRLAITNSTVYPNALGRDVLCFIITVTVKPPSSQATSWNVAKLFSAFIDLDTKIKAIAGKGRKEWKSLVTPLPDGRAWKDFAPSKIDQRKRALEAYIQSLLVAPLSDKSDFCEFLSSDKVKATLNGVKKQGYLTKKGKNFGGWKTRYFVLDGPVMEYYESRGGTHLGSIVISGAQIGRQNRPSELVDDRNFRHAFLIIEQAKKGGTRHVLCAESDSERDKWIEVLVRHVEPELSNGVASPAEPPSSSNPLLQRRRSNSRKSSRDVIVTAAQPMSNLSTTEGKFGGGPSPSLINSMESKRSMQPVSPSPSAPSLNSRSSATSTHQVSGRTPSDPASHVSSSSVDVTSTEPTSRATKRQSMIPGRPSHSAAYLSKVASEGLTIPGMEPRDKERDRKAKSGRFWPSFGKAPEKMARPVFGVALSDSIAIASRANLPAIVFRCIEYLEVKHAEVEEGIYRLSGSSAVIKGLKDRFDIEGDVNLIQVDEQWDPHAIAGLLKTFLRDLPNSLLTRDLHPRFLAVMDLIDSSARVAELSRLVSELPPHNYALLRALTAHLILIVKNSASNKMTLRNIGIVFSPTLGIPAGIFSELVSHFGPIFDDEAPEVVVVSAEDEASLSASNGDEETVRRKRNSMLYQAGGADSMLGLVGRSLDPALEDSSESENDDVESEAHSLASSESLSTSQATSRDCVSSARRA